jgi:hypothetical protein
MKSIAVLAVVAICLGALTGCGGQTASYTVLYQRNGATGTAPLDPNRYEPGQTVIVLGNISGLTLAGYSFSGWNTRADGTGTPYLASQTFTMASTNVVLFAQWTPTPTTGEVVGKVFWNTSPVPGAGVQIKTGPDFYQGTLIAETVTDSSGAFDLTEIPPGDYTLYAVKPEGSTEYQDWYGIPLTIKAGARRDAGVLRLSKIMTFLAPDDYSTLSTNPPTLSWVAVDGADRYFVELYLIGGGTDPILKTFTTATSFTPPQPLASGQYEWSVDAFSSSIEVAYNDWFFTVP